MTEAGQKVELKTERLLLRPFGMEDVDDVYEYARDEEYGRFLSSPQPYTRKDAEIKVAKAVLTEWNTEAMLALVMDGKVLGAINLLNDPSARVAELGYSLARSKWGNGLAVEAAEAVMDWGFAKWSLAKVYATTDILHTRSQRVLEKLGMAREGVLRSHVKVRGERVDEVYYGILRREWKSDGGPLPPVTEVVPAKRPIGTVGAPGPVELNTERLLLRPFKLEDVDHVYEYARDPEWPRYLADVVPQPYTRHDAEEFVARSVLSSWDVNPVFAAVYDSKVVGGINVMLRKPSRPKSLK